MRLYTISVQERPILVMSVDVDLPMEDAFTTDPEIMKAYRASRELEAKMRSMRPEVSAISDMREIEERLDTWLGEDLMSLTNNGNPIWNGNRVSLATREANPSETQCWRASLQAAIDAGEQDAGNEDWLAFLVPVEGA